VLAAPLSLFLHCPPLARAVDAARTHSTGQDMRERHNVGSSLNTQRRNSESVSQHDHGPQNVYELHMPLSATLAELLCVYIHSYRTMAVQIAPRRDRRRKGCGAPRGSDPVL